MKKLLFLLTICTAALCASATIRYVTPEGDDANDGLSADAPKLTIQNAIKASSSGDEVYVSAGMYNEAITLKDGVHIRGGYNATFLMRDIDVFSTIVDGTDVNKRLIDVSADCTVPTYVEGLILQNADHTSDGGGARIRGNVIMSRCIVRNCNGGGGGGINANASSADAPAQILNTTVELCNATGSGGGVYLYKNAIMDGCIVRGCDGQYGAVRIKAGCIARNCLLYNNSCTVDGWPATAGFYNPEGQVINCTVCNNYSAAGYAGIHSVSEVYNSIFWGNSAAEGFKDPVNFIVQGKSSDNFADQGFDGESFTTYHMSTTNMADNGPQFNNPTTFIGIPTTDEQITEMREADFSLLSTSPLINQGNKDKAPEKDILGVSRPIGGNVEPGAYEYDPDAAPTLVTGVDIYEVEVTVIEKKKVAVSAIISPANASDKRLTWSSDDPTIASVDALGMITGVKEGETDVHVTTVDGGFTDAVHVIVNAAPPVRYPAEVVEADALYKIEDYTIPSFIAFLVAKEAARIDSADIDNDLTVIPARVAEMEKAIEKLVGKDEPYNMVATFNGDPATHMGFCWFTNGGVTDGEVQLLAKANATEEDFATVDGLITLQAEATTTVPLHITPIQENETPAYDICTAAGLPRNTKFTYVSHKAQATELTPGTAYSWRVGFDGHWSDIAQFVTKDAEQGNFSFVYMTDSHIQDAEYIDEARLCADAVIKNESDAKFCVFPGDFVETGGATNSEWQWERWFEEAVNPVLKNMAMVVTDGNHDDSPNLNYDYHFNTDWGFYNVAETKPQFHGITYSFEYGDVLFLVFSLQDYWRAHGTDKVDFKCTYLSTDIRNWFLDQIEKHPNTKYRVTLAHKNIFSASGHQHDSETPLFREFMLPIFKECEIDLAIQGHDHCYEVIGPVDPDTRTAITSDISGVTASTGGTSENMTGLSGGTFTTDHGTVYFIGATCGAKRYYPLTREQMDADIAKHKVTNYYDLVTSKFGQPEAPSYTRFNVSAECIELKTYKVASDGTPSIYNTIKVKNNKPSSITTSITDTQASNAGEKFIRDGQIFIRKDGHTYNILGERIQ